MRKILFTIAATLVPLFAGVGVAGASTTPTAQQCAEAKQGVQNLKTLSAQYPTNQGLKLYAANAEAAYKKKCL
jgi:hypothetical protein